MLQGFYAAAVAAEQQMQRMGAVGNNIANVNTHGFKSKQPAFEALMYSMLTGADDAELQKGTGSRVVSTSTDFSDASLEATGRVLDYSIIGDGFFGIMDPATEEITYTRDGSFTYSVSSEQFDADGNPLIHLSDGEGNYVVDAQNQPIVVQDTAAKHPVGIFTIQYLDGLEHVSSSRFRVNETNGAVTAIQTSSVETGMLESSNVDLANEFVRMIESQRAFSYALKMVTTADEIETTVNNLST